MNDVVKVRFYILHLFRIYEFDFIGAGGGLIACGATVFGPAAAVGVLKAVYSRRARRAPA